MNRSSLVVASAAVALAACASAPHRIDKETTSPAFADRRYGDLLIIGAYQDRSFRVGSETAFVEELKAKGVTAAASYGSLPDLDSLGDSTALRNVLASQSHDAVVTIATVDEGYEYDYGDYLETRGLVYMLGGQPGAGTDLGALISWAGSGHYRLYVALWDAETLEPVWQSTTNSQSSGSESEDLKVLADFLVDALRARGLLEPPL